ncbi:MAG: BBE domain-containing protein [Acidimicrobiales bacterium]
MREFFSALQPYEVGASINFLDRDDQDRVPAAYGEDKDRRLEALKSRYDPDDATGSTRTSPRRPIRSLPCGTGQPALRARLVETSRKMVTEIRA